MNKEPSEIVKLTERISQDPKSKLFVPLAEEYKKTGDVEMAIHVLTEGLKNNPGYVTARSVLGRLLLERGDIAGAQKELEEVVKAIPDNLLAQRKLGDIYLQQNNPGEALKHYKVVLSLNSRDAEIASIIAGIEAGHAVGSGAQQPMAQPSREEAVKPETKQQPPISPAPQAQAAPAKTPPPAPAPVATVKAEEPEEIEEIIVVEQLEKEAPEQKAPAASFDFLAEQEQGSPYAPSVQEPAETPFAPAGQVLAEPVIHKEPEPEKLQPIAAEKPLKPEIVETEIREEAQAAHPGKAAEEPAEKSDDFTTDTLAELYIAQGFYEKAIDIYERMLADNPHSRGLKDKLEGVRAMASAVEEQTAGSPVVAEPQKTQAQKEPTPKIKETDLFAEPREYAPAGSGAEADAFVPPPAQKPAQVKPLFTDFEPREYMPPKAEAEPVEVHAKPVEEKREKVHAAPKSAKASRKETIARLESWLKNIKKEN